MKFHPVNSLCFGCLSKERLQLQYLKRTWEIGMERNATVKYVDNAS